MGNICARASNDLGRVEDQIKAIKLNDVLPGLSFPDEFKFLERLMMGFNYDLKNSASKFLKPTAELLIWATMNIQGKERTPENYTLLHDKMLTYFEISAQKFVPGYRHFPEDINWKDLEMLAKHNSFMTSMLTIRDGKPCISCMPPEAGESKSFLQTFVDALPQKDLVRFRLFFDSEMKFEKVDFYHLKEQKWQPRTIERESDQHQKVFALTRYAYQCHHATIHIFQGFVTAAMFSAEREAGDDAFTSWLEPLVQNVLQKMEDVIMLLIGSVFPSFLVSWMHADRTKVLDGMRDFLTVLGHVTSESEYYDTFIFRGIPKGNALREKLLPEFRQHTALVEGYAKGVTKCFNERQEFRLAEVEKDVSTFLEQCGKDYKAVSGKDIFGLASLEHWIIAQACAALTHGNTLSMTRVDLVEAVIGYQQQVNTFTKGVVMEELTGFGTIVEIVSDHCIYEAFSPKYLPDDLQKVMSEYQIQAQSLKIDCQAKYFDDEDTMRNFGWIITDYFPDMYDHKQLTLTTYV